jgi:signal recognition particle subunit SEC65
VLINMITAKEIATALRSAGWKARVSVPKGKDVVRVREEAPGRIKVEAAYEKTMLAVWMAEKTASSLRDAGYEVEAEDHVTFFYVTGRKSEG